MPTNTNSSHELFQPYHAPPTPEELNAYLVEAQKMRAEVLRIMVRNGWARVRSLFTSRQARIEGADEEMISALTALRASAEALRDNPDTHRDARTRLIEIVLNEEARLERLLRRIGPKGGGAITS